jgi:hypothetical protein
MSKKFGEMTPQERLAAMRRAADQFQAELRASADRLSAIMDEADAKPEPLPDNIQRAYEAGHQAAVADAQRCQWPAASSWQSGDHLIPMDHVERAAWMRGYGKQFAYWGGEKFDG